MNAETLLLRAAAGEAVTESERMALAEWLLADLSQTEVFGLTRAAGAAAVTDRLRRLPAVWGALRAGPVSVAGLAEAVTTPVREVFRFHLPLAQLLLEVAAGAGGRYVVAIAGVPASGKSVFAALLTRVLEALSPPFGVATVGLDGYHYSNAYLLAHRTPPAVGEAGPLKLYKGAHFTFDVIRLARDLRRLRAMSGTVRLPAYDRRLHDPVEGRVVVGPDDRLVLVEGNYLLCREPGWEVVPDLFDLRLFVDLPEGANREPMIARHTRGGRTRADAERHYERSDLPNTRLVAATRGEADIVVGLDQDYSMVGVSRGARAPAWLGGAR